MIPAFRRSVDIPSHLPLVYSDIDDADAVKASIATSALAVVYSGAQLDGLLGANTKMQQLTVSSSTAVGTYNLATITIVGTDQTGTARTVTATLTQVNGNETRNFQLAGVDVGMLSVTSITIPAMVNAGGFFTFGVADAIFDDPARAVRGAAGVIAIENEQALAASLPCVAGEKHHVFVKKIMDAATTAFPIVAYI